VLVAPWIPVECLDQCSSFAQFWQAQQFSPFSDWKAFIKTIPAKMSNPSKEEKTQKNSPLLA